MKTLINWIIKKFKKWDEIAKKYDNGDCGTCCGLDGGHDFKGNG